MRLLAAVQAAAQVLLLEAPAVLAAQVLKETGELPESSFYADVQLSKEQGSPFM